MRTVRAIYGRSAAISCGHPAAAAAGWEMLSGGGGVVDAALAAAAVLAVVLPQASTIGGDAFVLVHDAASGTTTGLNASGRSPAAFDIARLTQASITRGPLSCGVPGVVAGWETLHRRFGRRPWAKVLERAVDLAGNGFPASPGLASATQAHRDLLAKDPGANKLFLENGPLVAGGLFRQPALAATLSKIAEEGASGFYQGKVAQSLAAYVRSQGGALAEDDLRGCKPEWVKPLALPYRGLDVRVMPPNSFGLYMLLQLAALSDIDLSSQAPTSPARYAALVAAARAAFAAGDRCVADPGVVGSAYLDAVSDAGLAAVRKDFHARLGRGKENRGGTAVIAVSDDKGNACAIVQSVFLVYGSAVADPETGVLMNDRMLGFTLEQGHPNAAAPAKRPAHTLNPVMTFDGNGLRHVLLTPGGPGQTLTLTQVLQATVEHRLPLHEAVALPRWSMDLASDVVLEPEIGQATLAALRNNGINAQFGTSGSPFFGSTECVERLPGGGLAAVADDRREAYAVAI
jgi:gamma-glutamyltranspeptidase/glutathione hydrolase